MSSDASGSTIISMGPPKKTNSKIISAPPLKPKTAALPIPTPSVRHMQSLPNIDSIRAKDIQLQAGSVDSPKSPIVVTQGSILFDEVNLESARGGYGALFMGVHREYGTVALKRLDLRAKDMQTQLRRFNREATIWHRLRHSGILPFYGVYTYLNRQYLVSPFMEHGNLREYLTKNPNVDRCRFLVEISDALAYLHFLGIVHGDIKAVNILVSKELRALLCDFGLSKVDQETTSATLHGAGTLRWSSPELLFGKAKTVMSDTYAFGMTAYEVLSGETPFYLLSHPGQVTRIIIEGEKPPTEPKYSPQGISYQFLWSVIQKCWATKPEDRLSMSAAYDALKSAGAIFDLALIASPACLRLYVAQRHGIQELVSQDNWKFAPSTIWHVKENLASDLEIDEHGRAHITAIHTKDFAGLSLPVAIVYLAQGKVLRCWEYNHGSWKPGNLEAAVPDFAGSLCGSDAEFPVGDYSIFFGTSDGNLHELRLPRKIPNTLKTDQAEPLHIKPGTPCDVSRLDSKVARGSKTAFVLHLGDGAQYLRRSDDGPWTRLQACPKTRICGRSLSVLKTVCSDPTFRTSHPYIHRQSSADGSCILQSVGDLTSQSLPRRIVSNCLNNSPIASATVEQAYRIEDTEGEWDTGLLTYTAFMNDTGYLTMATIGYKDYHTKGVRKPCLRDSTIVCLEGEALFSSPVDLLQTSKTSWPGPRQESVGLDSGFTDTEDGIYSTADTVVNPELLISEHGTQSEIAKV